MRSFGSIFYAATVASLYLTSVSAAGMAAGSMPPTPPPPASSVDNLPLPPPEKKAQVVQELLKWKKSTFAQIAKQKNLYPTVQKPKEGEEYSEEELKRFYASQLLIERMQKLNPHATFSTDTPASLLTMEEFYQRVVAVPNVNQDDRRRLGLQSVAAVAASNKC